MKYILNPILWIIVILILAVIIIIIDTICFLWSLDFRSFEVKKHLKEIREINYFENPFKDFGGSYADGNEYY